MLHAIVSAHTVARKLCISCQVKHRAYDVNQKRRFLPSSHTPLGPHFLSFSNDSINNVCPFAALKQSTTDEMNGFSGKPYFISYKLNVF